MRLCNSSVASAGAQVSACDTEGNLVRNPPAILPGDFLEDTVTITTRKAALSGLGIMLMLPYLVTIFAVAGLVGISRGPAEIGRAHV